MNYNSTESSILKDFFQNSRLNLDSNIALIIESYIYNTKVEYHNLERNHYMVRFKKMDGFYKSWYKENDEVHVICNFKNEKLDGLFEAFYKHGQIAKKCYYKDGILDGLHQLWKINGRKSEEIYYKNGKKNGEMKVWNRRNKLVCHRIYENDNIIETIV